MTLNHICFLVTYDRQTKKPEITPLILKLHEENINVLKISDNEEKLEKYFFNILGGEMND